MYKYPLIGLSAVLLLVLVHRISSEDMKNCSRIQIANFVRFIAHADGLNRLNDLENNTAHVVTLENGAIYVNLLILDVHTLDQHHSSVQALIEATIRWKDLGFHIECLLKEPLVIPEANFNIWKPMFYLFGVRHAEVMHSPDNANQIVLYPDYVFEWWMQLSVTLVCDMDFTFYPYDNMTCKFQLNPRPAEYDSKWDGIQMAEGFSTLRSHWVVKIEPFYRNVTRANRSRTVAACHIVLKRYLISHIFTSYLQTLLVLFGVWFGFLLDADVAHVRMTLGLTGLAVLFIQYGNIYRTMAKVGYMRTIDIWMFFCAGMVLCALAEFSLICYIKRVAKCQHDKTVEVVEMRCAGWDKIGMIAYAAAVVLVLSAILIANVISQY